MAKVVGKVYKLKHFPASGRFGEAWSVKLDGVNIYFKTDKDPTGIAPEGASVEIEHGEVQDGKFPTAKILGLTASRTPAPAAVAVGTASYAGLREESIHYQSGRKDALKMVKLLVSAGGVKLPAKEANREEALIALVDSYTAMFYQDIATKGAVGRSLGEEATPETAPDPDAE